MEWILAFSPLSSMGGKKKKHLIISVYTHGFLSAEQPDFARFWNGRRYFREAGRLGSLEPGGWCCGDRGGQSHRKEEGKSPSIHRALSKPRCDKNSTKITDLELIKHREYVIFWKPRSSKSFSDGIKCHQNIQPRLHSSCSFSPLKPIPTVLLPGDSCLGLTNTCAHFSRPQGLR